MATSDNTRRSAWPTRSARSSPPPRDRARRGLLTGGVAALCAASVVSAVVITGQAAGQGHVELPVPAPPPVTSAASPAADLATAASAAGPEAAIAGARSATDAAVTRAAAAQEEAAAGAIDETDAGLVDPELGPGYPAGRWTDAKAAEAGRRLDELSAADPNGPLMTCLKAGNLYEDC